jgi:uncharacterized membrane protein
VGVAISVFAVIGFLQGFLFDRIVDGANSTYSLVNLAFATGVPPGHGHVYGSNAADGWSAIAAPDGWTDADTARLKALIKPDLN